MLQSSTLATTSRGFSLPYNFVQIVCIKSEYLISYDCVQKKKNSQETTIQKM